MNDLTEHLAKQAMKYGICDQWYSELVKIEDRKALMDMYVRGIDFCLRNNFPSNEELEKYFSDIMPDMGVYLNMPIDVKNIRPCVCLGNTYGKYTIGDYCAGEIFIKHDAKIDIVAQDNAFLMVNLFENAIINVTANDRAKVCIKQFGGTIAHKESGLDAIIKITQRNPNEF